jgi:hypothetical protein
VWVRNTNVDLKHAHLYVFSDTPQNELLVF